MVPVLKKKRFWSGVALVTATVFILFLPFFVSTATMTRFLVSRINAGIPGAVRVGSMLVGWQQGVLCQDIVYEDMSRGLRITVPRITSTQGLMELIFSPGNLGSVSLESPVAEIRVPAKSRSQSFVTKKRPQTASGSAFSWDKLAVQLQVRDGLIKTVPDGPHPEIGLKNIELYSNLSAGEIHYDLKFRSLDGQGDFSFKGRVNLPSGNKAFLETLFTDTEASIHGFQFKDYLAFAGRFQNLPTGDGIINADIHFKSIGLEDFEITGTARADGLQLTGGVLGQDNPYFDTLSVSIKDGQWSKLFWSFKKVQIQSEAGSLTCTAEVRDNRVRLNSSGNLDIPVLFDQFPHLLHVQEKAFVETGLLEYEADFLMDGDKGKFDFSSKLQNLGGFFDGRPFSWERPLTAILHGENNGLDINIRRFQVESPFMQAFGQGNLSSFSLEASADIGKTLVELNKLFAHPWAGSGELEFSADATAADVAGRYDVTSDLNISHFSLSRFEKVVIPNQYFSIVSSGQLPLSLIRDKKGDFDLQFALSSWLGESFFAVNGKLTPQGLTATRYSTDTNFRLDSFSRFIQALEVIPDQTVMGGDLQIQAAGYIDANHIGLDELDSRVNRFSLSRNGIQFSDREIRLYINSMVNDKIPSLVIHDLVVAKNSREFFRTGAGTNSYDLLESGIFLHDIMLDGEMGTVQLDELVVGDWHEPLNTLKAKGSLTTALQKLTPLLQNMGIMGTGISMAGSGKLVFAAGEGRDAGRFIDTDLRIVDFSLHRDGKDISPQNDLLLTMRLESGTADQDMAVKNLRFDGFPMEVSAEGMISRQGQGSKILLKGIISPRLANISTILSNGLDLDISMQGGGEQSFDFMYRWPADDGVNPASRLSFTSRLGAKNFRYKGINLDAVSIPFSMQEGRLQADMRAAMNGGQVDLSVRSDFTREPALLMIPDQSTIMTGVKLDETLAHGLFQGIHPLFGSLASPRGQLDVTVDSFTWPLVPQAGRDAEFAIRFDVSRIDLDSSGLLRRILTGFSLEEEDLKLRDNFILCTGKQGRITCSPVRIQVADSEMVMKGSVGMDKTLDYTLEVPITTRLVSPEVYHFLEGSTVRVPIGGTVDKPTFDQRSITAAVRDLVKEAAVKVVEKQANTLLPDIMDDVQKNPENN